MAKLHSGSPASERVSIIRGMAGYAKIDHYAEDKGPGWYLVTLSGIVAAHLGWGETVGAAATLEAAKGIQQDLLREHYRLVRLLYPRQVDRPMNREGSVTRAMVLFDRKGITL